VTRASQLRLAVLLSIFHSLQSNPAFTLSLSLLELTIRVNKAKSGKDTSSAGKAPVTNDKKSGKAGQLGRARAAAGGKAQPKGKEGDGESNGKT